MILSPFSLWKWIGPISYSLITKQSICSCFPSSQVFDLQKNSHMCCKNRNRFSWTLGRIASRSFIIIPPCLNMGREIHACVCYVKDLACFFLLYFFSLSKVPKIQIFTAFKVYNSRIVRRNGDMRTHVWFIIFFLPLKYWRKEN